jgi:formylglycine-generating enzyme required for sulfatase activity
MSWLDPSAEDNAFVAELSANKPLYRLLQVLALPQRIEPLLLRNARLIFAPGSDTELESEIWFHPMIQTRNAKAIVLRSGIARALADRLADEDNDLYNNAKRFIEEHTRQWPEPDRIEFDLRLAARTQDFNALKKGFQRMLNTLVNVGDDTERRELARWIKGALPTLMSNVTNTDEPNWLYQYVSAALGSAGQQLKNTSSQTTLPDWLAAVLPSGKEQKFALQIRPGVLEVLNPTQGGHPITLTLPLPTPVLLTFDDGSESRWETIWQGHTIKIPHPIKTLTLQTLNGKRFRLKILQTDEEFESQADVTNILLLVYVPEDHEQATQIANWLLMQGITVELVEQPRESFDSHSAQAPVMRLWTESAARYWQNKAVDEQSSPSGVLLRTDAQAELPLGYNESSAQVLNLPGWHGDEQFADADRFLNTLNALLKGQIPDAFNQLPESKEAEKEKPSPIETFAIQLPLKQRLHTFYIEPIMDHNIINNSELILRIKSNLHYSELKSRIEYVFRERLSGIHLKYVAMKPPHIPHHKIFGPDEFSYFKLENYGRPWTQLKDGLTINIIDHELAGSDEFGNPKLELWAIVTPVSEFDALLEEINDLNTPPKRRLEIGDKIAEMGDARPGVGLAEYSVEPTYAPEIKSLLQEIESIDTQPPRRLEIGDQLAELGDPRPGVGLDENGLPAIDWVEIPGGEFIYGEGEKQQTLTLDTFYIARYPVTNIQYQAFIDAGGYDDERWWQDLTKPNPDRSFWQQPNRPRTNVDWYEAMAYCRWLTEHLGYEIRLPTEKEWEKSARGKNGLIFPWGNDYKAGYANLNEQYNQEGPWNLNQTTAVGLYPHGSSSYGVEDMAGNIWEWCQNNSSHPKKTVGQISNESRLRGNSWASYRFEKHEDFNDNTRALRGGSWITGPKLARATLRWERPDIRHYERLGFRVLSSLPLL